MLRAWLKSALFVHWQALCEEPRTTDIGRLLAAQTEERRTQCCHAGCGEPHTTTTVLTVLVEGITTYLQVRSLSETAEPYRYAEPGQDTVYSSYTARTNGHVASGFKDPKELNGEILDMMLEIEPDVSL